MFRGAVAKVKEAGICLAVNTVLNSVKGDLDLSFGSGLYTKYGIKDEKGYAQPIGRFDPVSLAYIPTDLAQAAKCSGWSTITTFKFNNHVLSSEHIPLILSILKALPNFRPSTIEIKGNDFSVMSDLVPAIYDLYETKPKIVFTNAPTNTRSSGAVGGIGGVDRSGIRRTNSNNSNNNRSRRNRVRPAGVRAPNSTANSYRGAANALRHAAATGNTSGVSAAIAAALKPNENLPNVSGPLRNPFKPGAGLAGSAAPPAKKSWPWGGRRRTRHRGAKKLKVTRRKLRR